VIEDRPALSDPVFDLKELHLYFAALPPWPVHILATIESLAINVRAYLPGDGRFSVLDLPPIYNSLTGLRTLNLNPCHLDDPYPESFIKKLITGSTARLHTIVSRCTQTCPVRGEYLVRGCRIDEILREVINENAMKGLKVLDLRGSLPVHATRDWSVFRVRDVEVLLPEI
jgi:hypothetical protein